jgi:PEP-CTERM/exosortase A-associated glycosyltransferase
MKVLHVLDHSRPVMSGYSTRSGSIVSFQKALGLDPVVVTSPKHPQRGPAREILDEVAHYRTGTAGGRNGGVPYLREIALMARLAARISQVARAEGARILHAHSPVLNGLPALWAGRRLGIPVVYEARAFWEDAAVDHGTTREGSLRYRVSRALESTLFKRADAVVVIAAAMQEEIARRGIVPRRLIVVPNGVDVERFRPMPRSEALAQRLGLNGGPVLGFIGSFYRYEGLRFLVEAVPELRARLTGARVLLVGGGEEEAQLRTLSVAVEGAVIFAGQVPHEQVREYYSLIDIFVCPRRRMRLTELVTPLKPLEAMAMGRAVLGSDVGGLAELIEDGVTGILFAAESRSAFVEAAGRLGENARARSQIGERARESVQHERTWRRVVGRYLPLYESLRAAV